MDQKPDCLLSGQTIQLQHCKNNQYLFSNKMHLSTGSKCQMLGCTPLYQDEGCHFEIHLAYQDYGNLNDQRIYYGDLVYLKQGTKAVTMHHDLKSQVSTSQKETVLTPLAERLMPNQIFAIVPSKEIFSKMQAFHQFEIRQAAIVNFISIETNYSLHSHTSQYKQKEISEYKEVTGFSQRDDNDEWMLYIHPSNFANGIPQLAPRFKRHVHHGDKVILRNCQVGGSLHSHLTNYKSGSKQQEVTLKGKLPRDNNDLWELVIFKKDVNARSSQIVSHLNYKSYFCLLHSATNQLLTNVKGAKLQDGLLEVCCKEGQLNHDEWQCIPLKQEQTNLVTLDEAFAIRHTPSGMLLGATAEPSNPTKTQWRVYLTDKMSNNTVWAFESVISDYDD